MGVNEEALQLHIVYKKLYFLLQVILWLCDNFRCYSSSQVVPACEHNIVSHKWRERGSGENLEMAHSWEQTVM